MEFMEIGEDEPLMDDKFGLRVMEGCWGPTVVAPTVGKGVVVSTGTKVALGLLVVPGPRVT